jgi:hypothetical protein
MEKEETTPATEVIESEETVNDDTQEESTEEAEATVGDIQEESEDTSSADNIPKARLDKEIRRRKDLEAKLAEATKEEDGDSTPEETTEKSDLEARLAKIENKDKAEKLNAILESNFAKALEEAPEFQNIVNMDVLKQQAKDPKNKDKTYSQILDDVYGNAIEGRRTVETTTPRGGANNEKLDLARAGTDNEYLKKVLEDPVLKAEYNKDLEQRIML